MDSRNVLKSLLDYAEEQYKRTDLCRRWAIKISKDEVEEKAYFHEQRAYSNMIYEIKKRMKKVLTEDIIDEALQEVKKALLECHNVDTYDVRLAAKELVRVTEDYDIAASDVVDTEILRLTWKAIIIHLKYWIES